MEVGGDFSKQNTWDKQRHTGRDRQVLAAGRSCKRFYSSGQTEKPSEGQTDLLTVGRHAASMSAPNTATEAHGRRGCESYSSDWAR